MKTALTLVLFLTITLSFTIEDKDADTNSYIGQYSLLAIEEMQRSGIPASIILAQAIVESQSGKSDLAKIANNHFGIKCKSYWKGETFYKKDDDKDAHGNIIPSCFRAYESDIASYKDHTDFLMHRKYYQSLFSIEKGDYKRWAHGLKKCGYATDPTYAFKLIKIIEKYHLYHYDKYTFSSNAVKQVPVKKENVKVRRIVIGNPRSIN